MKRRLRYPRTGRLGHTVLKRIFGQRPSSEDACIKMDQIVTVQLGGVGADMVHKHERTAALSSWSGYLVNRYQFNTQILSPHSRIITRLHMDPSLFLNFSAHAVLLLCVHRYINIRLH